MSLKQLSERLSDKLSEIEEVCAEFKYDVMPALVLRHELGASHSALLTNDNPRLVAMTVNDLSDGTDTDYKHIDLRIVLVAADALTPEQLQRKREGTTGLAPLSEESIDEVLAVWRKRLLKAKDEHQGYFLMGYSS